MPAVWISADDIEDHKPHRLEIKKKKNFPTGFAGKPIANCFTAWIEETRLKLMFHLKKNVQYLHLCVKWMNRRYAQK